jgi:hypothetical protein
MRTWCSDSRAKFDWVVTLQGDAGLGKTSARQVTRNFHKERIVRRQNTIHLEYASMSKSRFLPVIVLGIVVVGAFALNPSADQHRDKIKSVIAERSPLEGILGLGQLTSLVSKYHNLGVASYTTVGEKTASVGVLGMVYVSE